MTTGIDKLRGLVNASGFAFQIAVEAAVEDSQAAHGWTAHVREYPWRTDQGAGFVDLVLRRGPLFLIVECKRVRGADWVFLMPDEDQHSRTHAMVRWTNTVPHRRPLADWDDIQIDPGSSEAEFCVVRGQGEGDRPLLERLAGPLVQSVEAVASDLLMIHEQVGSTCVLVPVLVTTATLHVGRFDPAAINLSTGDIVGGDFREVGSVRFRKSIAPTSVPLEYEPEALSDLTRGSVRTIFVVNASYFVEWLSAFSTRVQSGSAPWDFARERANAIG